MTAAASPWAAFMIAVLAAEPALAFRPFDGTDASVLESGSLELEFQPAGVLLAPSARELVAPQATVNLGLGDSWEASAEGRTRLRIDSALGSPAVRLTDVGLVLKRVVVPGSLQGRTGPSVAGELTGLAPDVTAGSQPLMSLTMVVSHRWEAATFHLAGAVAVDPRTDLTAQNVGLFSSAILEGPASWPVRPVVELIAERATNLAPIYSSLAGFVWQAAGDLALDGGLRVAREGPDDIIESRLGATLLFRNRPQTVTRPQ